MDPKRRLIWPGLFLVLAGWDLLLPAHTSPHPIGWVMLLAGVLCMGFSFLDSAPRVSRFAGVYYGVAGITVAAGAPYPFRLGGVFMVLGAVMLMFRQTAPRLHRVGYGMAAASVILVVQSACAPLWQSVGARFHGIGFMAPVVSGCLRFLGCQAGSAGTTVCVEGETGIWDYAIAAEYFDWMFVAQALVGAGIWQLFCPGRRRSGTLLAISLAFTAYAIGRYVLLALLFLDLPRSELFWRPWIVLVSWLPLFAWLTASGWATSEGEATELRADGAALPLARWGGFAAAAAAFVAVLAWGWEDPGRTKRGRLVIDETHSAWELVDRPYDTEWFGEESGYNYYCLSQYLGYYYEVRHNRSMITPELLESCDVLIIKTPTSRFSAEEIDAIERFVKRGGGLFLIGDHTNVFGTSTYLNPVGRRFGIQFNPDATYDLATGGLSLYRRPQLLPHPIVQRLPPFLFATSCTLDVQCAAAIPMNGYGLRVAGHDYSTPSFFTSRTEGPHIGFGLFPQMAAAKVGLGRVVAFSDSTVFSNFWVHVPGKPELLLGCTEWLNRTNRLGMGRLVLWLTALGLAGAALFCFRGPLLETVPLAVAASSIGFLGGAYLAKGLNRIHYPAPAPSAAYPVICFERTYSHFEMPERELLHDPRVDFHTLYVWVQRVGVVPRVSRDLDEATRTGAGVVMLNPGGRISPTDRERLRKYVHGGGVLFVFDSLTNRMTSAEALAGFGLGLAERVITNASIVNSAGEQIAENRAVRVVSGGEGVLFTANREPVLSVARQGAGAVVWCGDSELFSNATLGATGVVPNEKQKRLYGVIFELFRLIRGSGATEGSR